MLGYECACLMTYYRICCTVWNFIDNPLSDYFFFGNWVVLQYLEALHPVKIFNLISCAEYSWNLPCQYHKFILSCKIQHIAYSGLRKLADLCSLKSWRKYLAAPVKCCGCFYIFFILWTDIATKTLWPGCFIVRVCKESQYFSTEHFLHWRYSTFWQIFVRLDKYNI